MKVVKILLALLAGIALSGMAMPAARALTAPPAYAAAAAPQIVVQWGEPAPPPGNWSAVWHRGFHAGAQAAHRDIRDGRAPDVRRHEKFRHPDVRPDARRDFRDGFQRGYRMVYDRDWHRGH